MTIFVIEIPILPLLIINKGCDKIRDVTTLRMRPFPCLLRIGIYN